MTAILRQDQNGGAWQKPKVWVDGKKGSNFGQLRIRHELENYNCMEHALACQSLVRAHQYLTYDITNLYFG